MIREMIAAAGLAAIVGCSSASHTVDTLADHLYEKGGIAVILSQEDLQEVADDYTKKIQEDDSARYRWLRCGLNLQLASQSKDKKYAKLMLEDAQKYVEFEKEDHTVLIISRLIS